MRQFSTVYILGFSAAVCLICSFLVSSSAVGLKKRQMENVRLDKQKSVLLAVGKIGPKEKVTRQIITERFESIKPVVVNLKTGVVAADIDAATYDQGKATKDPEQSTEAPANRAKVARIPNNATVYQLIEDEKVVTLVLPIVGKGLWSTMYGFLALDADTTTVKGIIFYAHGETPGLGGEIDNPKWRALWVGRKAFDENWTPKIMIIKGPADTPEKDPYRVDGLSGATLTGRGVSNTVQFWLGENGFGPYLAKFRETQ